MRPATRAAIFGGSLAVSLGVALLVGRGHDSPWLALPWALSLVPFALAADDRAPRKGRRLTLPTAALFLVAAALPVLVRLANFDASRLHGDEYLTGYFSATHDFAHTSFFGFMPEKWEWQGQFPKPFFFLQRGFFALFGISPMTPHFSVQIYVAIVSLMLFLIVREMFGSAAGLVAVVLNAFFAASVYLETLGFMFISSTAIVTVLFYFALREYRTGGIFYAALAGMACGFCYLTYYSSYLAFPLLALFYAGHWLRARKGLVVRNFLVSLAGMLVVLAPFVVYGLRSGNYVQRRASEVSLLKGEWSPYRAAIIGGASPVPVIRENLALSLRSLAKDGIGGHGGYDFGQRALFNRFSLYLFLAGLLAALVLMFRKPELLFVLFVAASAFLFGIVLTIPPPAYHRFSVAFPFLVIIMTLPFSLLLSLPKVPGSVRYALVAGTLLLFASVNQRQFTEAVFRDHASDDPRLFELLNRRYGDRKLYIAAYDAFGLQKVFYFFDRWKGRPVQTGFHRNLLRNFNPKEKYVYVMTLGDVNRKLFEKADPKGRYFRYSIGYSIFAN